MNSSTILTRGSPNLPRAQALFVVNQTRINSGLRDLHSPAQPVPTPLQQQRIPSTLTPPPTSTSYISAPYTLTIDVPELRSQFQQCALNKRLLQIRRLPQDVYLTLEDIREIIAKVWASDSTAKPVDAFLYYVLHGHFPREIPSKRRIDTIILYYRHARSTTTSIPMKLVTAAKAPAPTFPIYLTSSGYLSDDNDADKQSAQKQEDKWQGKESEGVVSLCTCMGEQDHEQDHGDNEDYEQGYCDGYNDGFEDGFDAALDQDNEWYDGGIDNNSDEGDTDADNEDDMSDADDGDTDDYEED